ncbi:MAG: hypothetical protein MUC62_06565, partial [Candidatus Thermoplasmatota archaeon]|nr:hypothetical protein [Candidatus Thermoplasmatota archaeon]
ITLWHPVMLKTGYTLPVFTEDTTVHWNLSAAFAPEMDQAGAALTFGVGPEGFPAGWTFTPMMDGVYTHWVVTPPANFNGWAHVNVTAEDTNEVATNNIFNLTVVAVNDKPVIEGIMVGDVLKTPETWNAGNTTVYDNKTAINLTVDEDASIMLMVHATDIDSEITIAMTADAALYSLALTEYVNATNVTYTVPTNYTLTTVANANGVFWAELNVTDGTLYVVVWVQVIVDAVNDAPTATEAWEMTYARKTGEEINLTLSDIEDIDGDNVIVMWYIDGTVVPDWSMIYFRYAWTTAGTYNVSAKITDGTETIDISYFLVIVTLANTGPTITLVQALPKGMTDLDAINFLLKGEVEEGTDVVLTCTASDVDGDILTYTWTNNVNPSWKATGANVIVPASVLEVGKSYTFTCVVSDGSLLDSDTSKAIKIVEKDEEEEVSLVILVTPCIILVVALGIPIVLVVIVIVLVKRSKKKTEVLVAPEGEAPPVEGEAPVEGQIPLDGESPPVEGGVPPAEGEVPAPETPEGEVPAEPEPPQAA